MKTKDFPEMIWVYVSPGGSHLVAVQKLEDVGDDVLVGVYDLREVGKLEMTYTLRPLPKKKGPKK